MRKRGIKDNKKENTGEELRKGKRREKEEEKRRKRRRRERERIHNIRKTIGGKK